MFTGYSTAAGRSSRRKVLRLAGGGLMLTVLGAGTAGCGEDVADNGGSGGSEGSKGADSSQGDVASDGKTPGPLWSKPVSAQSYGNNNELVAVDGVVVVTGDPLAALDAATGKPKWSLEGGAIPGAPLLLGSGTLYLASGKYDGTVAGYDPASGKETWRSRLGKEYRQPKPIAVDDKQVYVIAEILEGDGSSHTNVIAALDSGTGRVVWKEQRDLGTEQGGVHAVVQGRYLVYTDFKKNLTVRDTATGEQVWTQKTAKTSFGVFAVHEDLVIVPQGRNLQAFNLSDGVEKWSLQTEKFDTFKEPTVLEDVLLVSDSTRALWSVDPQTGKKIWQSKELAEANAPAPRQFVRVGGTLYGATDLDKEGGVHAFDAETGALRWTFNDKSGDSHAWIVASDGTYVFALHGKQLHALPA